LSLNPSQLKALDHNRNLILSAGAGSGKTTILIERIIQLLLVIDGLKLSDILAITFTKKAANEMKERLFKRLIELQRSEIEELYEKKIEKTLHEINQLDISTIHSFLTNFLKQFSFSIGVDSDFQIIDPSEYQQLFTKTLETFINRKLESNDSEFSVLFRSFGKKRIRFFFEYLTENELLLKTEVCFSLDEQTDRWKNIYHDYIKNLNQKFLDDNPLQELLSNISSSLRDEISKPNKTVQLVIDLITEKADVKSIVNSVLTQKGELKANLLKPASGTNIEAKLILLTDYLIDYQDQFLEEFNSNDLEYLNLQSVFLKYGLSFNQDLLSEKNKRNVLTYNDLEKLTLEALRKDPTLRDSARHLHKFVLIDEFQDTNFIQWEILSYFLKKEDQSFQEQKTFLVGDPKQSIYSFRDADIRVFNTASEQILKQNLKRKKTTLPFKIKRINGLNSELLDSTEEERNGVLYLSNNYRTNGLTLGFINKIFANLFKEKSSLYDIASQDLTPFKDSDEKNRTEININFSEIKSAEYQHISTRILDLVKNGYAYSDITILLRSRSNSESLESIFKRADIPFHSYLSQSFYKQQEIIDIHNLIQFTIFPHDNLTLFSILKSPFFNYKDSFFTDFNGDSLTNYLENKAHKETLEKLNRLRYLSKQLPIELFIHMIIEQFNYYKNYNNSRIEQAAENINKLINELKQVSQHENSSLITVYQYLRRKIANSEKEAEAEIVVNDFENKVKIMTIHNSKGLQFPVVIIPDLERSFLGKSSSFYKHLDYGFFNQQLTKGGFIEAFFKYDSFLQREAEEKRTLYVAMTRVEEKLILTSSLKEKKIPKNSYLSLLNRGLENSIDNFNEIHNPLYSFEFLDDIVSDEKIIKNNYVLDIKFKKRLKNSSKIDKAKHVYSVTRIEQFKNDFNKYIQQYEYGFFKEDYQNRLIQFKSLDISPTLYGTILHQLLEQYEFICDKKNYIQLLLKQYNIVDLDKKIQNKLELSLDRFLTSTKTKAIRNAKQRLTETEINLIINDESFTGKLDLIIETESSEWIVFDYKSNKVDDKNYLNVASKYHLQMESYAFLLSRVIPNQKEYKVALYFIEADLLYEKSYSLESLEQLASKWNSIIQDIRKFESNFYQKLI
jgi:ATP-dependent helicase/nuclease subunit A